MVLFEGLTWLIASMYPLFWLAVFIFSLLGVLTDQLPILLSSLALGFFLWIYPNISFWAYRRYVENIPLKRGWHFIPLIKQEHLVAAHKFIAEPQPLLDWIQC